MRRLPNPRFTLEYLRNHGHHPTYRRRRTGTSMGGGTTYGYRIECECGWQHKTNENKRGAVEWHNDHLREAAETTVRCKRCAHAIEPAKAREGFTLCVPCQRQLLANADDITIINLSA